MRTPTNESLAPDTVEASRPAKPTLEKGGKAQPERKCILSGEHDGRDHLILSLIHI